MTHPSDETLPCGHELLELVEQVTDGKPAADPAHQADCAHCQKALARIRAANDQLRSLAGEEIRVPRGLARKVMAQLRRERGRVAIASGPDGIDTASDQVIEQIARGATLAIGGIRRCSISLEPATADGTLALTVHLTAVLGPPLPALAEAVRTAVTDELHALTGLRPARVSVAIEDVELP